VQAKDYSNLDRKLDIVFENISKKSKISQIKTINSFIYRIDHFIKKNPNNLELLKYLKSSFEIQLKLIKNESEISINTHESLILRFGNIGNHKILIDSNKDNIKSANSIFIFRNYKNISSRNLKEITFELKKINPDILLFIDQE
jgi:hypothetical protein